MYYANAITLELLSYKLEEKNNEWNSKFLLKIVEYII
jgi:hypothetical protein